MNHQVEVYTCPCCREWWDVEQEGEDGFLVLEHDNSLSMVAQVYSESSNVPLCPKCGQAMALFLIDDPWK